MAVVFREQIRKELSDLSLKDTCFFAWLCAVRALPLLGARGNLKYWGKIKNKDKRQSNLLALFRALDYGAAVHAIAGTTAAGAAITAASATAYAAYAAAAAAAYAAADAAYAAAAAAAYTAADAADATTAAADAAYTAYTYADATTTITTTAVAAYAATAADAYATAADAATAAVDAAAAKRTIDLKPILLNDLTIIKSKKRDFNHDTALYKEIWGNFQSALRDIGCSYWGDWYASIFAKGFVLDDDDYSEIKMRLNVPGEIIEQGAGAVARFTLDLKEWGAERLDESRVLILGEKGSGKTSLALRIKDPGCDMPGDEDSTEGVDIIDWRVPGIPGQRDSELNVHIWDFAGHVITHAAHRCFMSDRCLYILLINGRTEGDSRTEYWLEQVRNYGGNSKVLIVVNIRDKHNVDLQENALMKEFTSIAGFFYLDIKKGGKPLEAFRQKIMSLLRDDPLWKNNRISAPAYEIKEALRQRFSQGREFIKREDFERIAEESGMGAQEHKRLLEDLHALGICLWYGNDDMSEFSEIVLNPSWISHGIYRLINWGLKNEKYILAGSDFKHTFTGEDALRYPKERAAFLFRLMKTYQLAFFKKAEMIFVPLLLPADRTASAQLPEFPFGERLRMEYRTDQALPPYTVARLAVLHSAELDQKKSWRFGALLQWEETTALVEESERARSVTVHVKGPKQTQYISRLRDTLDGIFNDYKDRRPELRYEVLLPDEWENGIARRFHTSSDITGLMQPEGQIIGNYNAGQKLVIDVSRLPLVDPKPTISGYSIHIGSLTIYNLSMKDQLGNLVVGDSPTNIDQSQTIKVEFHDCSNNFQGELNALGRSLRKLPNSEGDDLAEELEETASDLDEAVKMIPAGITPGSEAMKEISASLQKKGFLKPLENLFEKLCDKDSQLHKKAEKLRNGVEAVQKLGACYNDFAQWFGIPQVPTPLLGKHGK